MENGKLNIDWSLNQKTTLSVKKGTQLNINATAKDADIIITL